MYRLVFCLVSGRSGIRERFGQRVKHADPVIVYVSCACQPSAGIVFSDYHKIQWDRKVECVFIWPIRFKVCCFEAHRYGGVAPATLW